jgi:hypothetical protein
MRKRRIGSRRGHLLNGAPGTNIAREFQEVLEPRQWSGLLNRGACLRSRCANESVRRIVFGRAGRGGCCRDRRWESVRYRRNAWLIDGEAGRFGVDVRLLSTGTPPRI